MTTPAEVLVSEARRWVGRPFLHQGTTWDGVDCIGLVVAVCKACEVIPPDFYTGVYGRVPANDMLKRRVAEYCRPLPGAGAGAMLVIRWTRQASHVAICTGETMIHSNERMGGVVEHGYRGRWLRMTDSVWALPGVDY